MKDLKEVPLPQKVPDDAGLEQIREMAHEMAYNISFHEVAIADAFKAERELREYGRRLIELVGWPAGWVTFE